MGGYDIFETVRDAATGEYMPPSNVGMPFNSPYDDFLLVTDEQNGVGWWATDRNSLEDMVTLYVYMLPEMRRNVDPESDDLMSLARLSEYKLTWEADTLDNSAQYARGHAPSRRNFISRCRAGKSIRAMINSPTRAAARR